MSQKSELQRLADMIAAGERAIRHLGGVRLDELTADEMRSDALVRALEVMGEACKSISQPVRDRFPALPWRQIAAMRDRLIHGYDSVDWQIVHDTTTRFVPDALTELRSVYAVLSADQSPEAPV